jgi:agmatinase
LLGVPFDAAASFRLGARFGPEAIREVSEGLESYSPALDRDLLDLPFADLGNLEIPSHDAGQVAALLEAATAALLGSGVIPAILGGVHSITPGAVAAAARAHPGLAVIQLDAHADLRNEFGGTEWSHASAMRRVLEIIEPGNLIQCGIRSGTAGEFSELRRSGRLVAPDAPALRAAMKALGDAPLYLSIDLDIFDPALLPGTGTPEPGGIDWPTFADLLLVIPWERVVACDVVELAPRLDPSGASSLLAAKVVREVLLSLPRG